MTFRVLPFLLLFHFSLCTLDNFDDLVLDGPYTTWNTEGNLSSGLFRVVRNTENPPQAIKVSVNFDNSTVQNPLTLTVIQGKTIQSFALPRVQSHNGRKFEYWHVSDNLCNFEDSNDELSQPVYISITSSLPSTFNLWVRSVEDFRIGHEKIETTASPSEPTFHIYTFPDGVEKVNIRAFSEDRLCAKLMARRTNCPLFDGSGLLEWSDVYFFQTFTKFAGLTLKKTDIGPQFHLAISVEPDDSNCGLFSNSSNSRNTSERVKLTSLAVVAVSASPILSLIPISVYITSMGVVLLLTYLNYKWYDSHENNEPNIFEGTDSEGNVIVDKIYLFEPPHMIVSHYAYQKQRLVKDIKYFKFLFFQIFGSILPALTILFQNSIQSDSNNWDNCYLNYLCTQNVFNFCSFNAMSSSTSMAVIGILNLIIVFRKKIFRYQIPRFPKTHGIQKRDAPKVVFCLGLIAMGIPRMITYNCQDKSTEHFYVYTTAWVNYAVIFWVYSRRHGVRKWQQFFIIAVSSIFGLFTLAEITVEDSRIHRILIKVFFVLFTTFSTGFFCFKYYYERPSGLRCHQWVRSPIDCSPKVLCDENGVYQPLKSKIFLVVVSMLFSIVCSSAPLFIPGCTVYGISDFYIQSQLTIYAVYYYIQKIRFERNSFTFGYAIYTFFLTFSIAFFSCVSSYLGSHLKTFKVTATPAQSREFNVECILPGIDWGHIRHYIGALVWFMFLLLMDFLDSNIKGVPKKHIFVF